TDQYRVELWVDVDEEVHRPCPAQGRKDDCGPADVVPFRLQRGDDAGVGRVRDIELDAEDRRERSHQVDVETDRLAVRVEVLKGCVADVRGDANGASRANLCGEQRMELRIFGDRGPRLGVFAPRTAAR